VPDRPILGVTERPGDLDLLLRVGTGDVEAAGDLYDRYGAALYAVAVAVTGNGRQAEAAVASAFRTASSRARGAPGRPWSLLARATLAGCRTDA
jgi:hypothetical protein